MKLSNINEINSNSNKLISDLKLSPDEFVSAKSFLEYLTEIQNKIHKEDLKDKR